MTTRCSSSSRPRSRPRWPRTGQPPTRGRSAARPVVARRLARGQRLRALEAGRHRRLGAGHDLVVVDVEHAQPALLPERQADEAAELNELRLAEVAVHPVPELVVRVEMPGDRLRVGERRLLALVVGGRRLEVEQLVVLAFDEPERAALLRALVAAVLALDRARDVDAAQLLDAMVEDAVAEDVVPAVGEEPEARRDVRADGRALRARR